MINLRNKINETEIDATTTNSNNVNNLNPENKNGILNKITQTFTNKPIKKVYRVVLLGILVVILNNTNNVNITHLLSNTFHETICKNLTLLA